MTPPQPTTPYTLLLRYFKASFAKTRQAQNILTVLECMYEQKLDATMIEDNGDGNLCIIWENGYNKTHVANIEFCSYGPVIGSVRSDSLCKTWFVKDISPPCDSESLLQLNIDETLEYIRHFIWANHDV